MKILLLGEYSSLHSTLADGLRLLGHEVTVASDGCKWMENERDINLSRPGYDLYNLALRRVVYKKLRKRL